MVWTRKINLNTYCKVLLQKKKHITKFFQLKAISLPVVDNIITREQSFHKPHPLFQIVKVTLVWRQNHKGRKCRGKKRFNKNASKISILPSRGKVDLHSCFQNYYSYGVRTQFSIWWTADTKSKGSNPKVGNFWWVCSLGKHNYWR